MSRGNGQLQCTLASHIQHRSYVEALRQKSTLHLLLPSILMGYILSLQSGL